MNRSPLKIAIIMCLLSIAFILSSFQVTGDPGINLGESGETSSEVDPGPPVHYPLILSEHKDQKTARFWASPWNLSYVSQTVYDQWTFIIPGHIDDNVVINFSGKERFNFTMVNNIEYIPFDASTFAVISGYIEINGTRYLFKFLNVQHQELSFSPVDNGRSKNKYDEMDLLIGSIKSGFGVACSGVLVVPIFVILAWAVKSMRGVKKW